MVSMSNFQIVHVRHLAQHLEPRPLQRPPQRPPKQVSHRYDEAILILIS